MSRADARPGDLVFFFSGLSHVGLYLGQQHRWCTRHVPVSRCRCPASTPCRSPGSADLADPPRATRRPPVTDRGPSWFSAGRADRGRQQLHVGEVDVHDPVAELDLRVPVLAADHGPVAGRRAVERDGPVVLAGPHAPTAYRWPAANVYCSGEIAWYGHPRRVCRLLRVRPSVDGTVAGRASAWPRRRGPTASARTPGCGTRPSGPRYQIAVQSPCRRRRAYVWPADGPGAVVATVHRAGAAVRAQCRCR